MPLLWKSYKFRPCLPVALACSCNWEINQVCLNRAEYSAMTNQLHCHYMVDWQQKIAKEHRFYSLSNRIKSARNIVPNSRAMGLRCSACGIYQTQFQSLAGSNDLEWLNYTKRRDKTKYDKRHISTAWSTWPNNRSAKADPWNRFRQWNTTSNSSKKMPVEQERYSTFKPLSAKIYVYLCSVRVSFHCTIVMPSKIVGLCRGSTVLHSH